MSDDQRLETLDPTQKALLAKVLSSSTSPTGAPTASKFRAENYQHLSTLDEMEHRGWIRRVDDRYLTSPAVLPLLGSSSAKQILARADAIYRVLWNRYRLDQNKPVLIDELSKELDLPREEVVSKLQIMVQLPSWWGGYSNDLLQEDAFVAPGEGILANVSFTALARQVHSWNVVAPTTLPLVESHVPPFGDSRFQAGGVTGSACGSSPQNSLHPKIAQAVGNLAANGHHWEAVFSACKALILHVKSLSGRQDLDGVALVRQVFSKNNPILRFNALQSATEVDEQEGMMHLYEGVIMALRNPGGHTFPSGPESRALQYLDLISMLAERADEALLAP